MESKTKAQLEKENKELKEKLRIKSGGCRNCQHCSEYRDNPRHDAWSRECTCGGMAPGVGGIDCNCAGFINSFRDAFFKDDACYCGCSKKQHGEK